MSLHKYVCIRVFFSVLSSRTKQTCIYSSYVYFGLYEIPYKLCNANHYFQNIVSHKIRLYCLHYEPTLQKKTIYVV